MAVGSFLFRDIASIRLYRKGKRKYSPEIHYYLRYSAGYFYRYIGIRCFRTVESPPGWMTSYPPVVGLNTSSKFSDKLEHSTTQHITSHRKIKSNKRL